MFLWSKELIKLIFCTKLIYNLKIDSFFLYAVHKKTVIVRAPKQIYSRFNNSFCTMFIASNDFSHL